MPHFAGVGYIGVADGVKVKGVVFSKHEPVHKDRFLCLLNKNALIFGDNWQIPSKYGIFIRLSHLLCTSLVITPPITGLNDLIIC
jgi:hypothetical protein